ncbi:hypothetical protein PQX77_016282 [Marasmius sp. AFHP31]|nr:hypothetical protein PQX77_016282 [Marasmius sp. AFHP31]
MASKPCSNLVHAVEPTDQYHWHHNPDTDNWITSHWFDNESELVPLPFPSPAPVPEPETNLTAPAPLLFAASPTPVADTTDSHASQTTTSTISSMSTQATANTTLEALLTCLVNQQQSQQAQLDAIKDAFKANKDQGAVIAKPAVFKGNVDDVIAL